MNDWSRFYFPEILPALDPVGELMPGPDRELKLKTAETIGGTAPKHSQTPENRPGQELRWATLRRAALDSPDFQKFLSELIQKDVHVSKEERYQRLFNYLIKGMRRFPSLTGFDWDMYKIRTTVCLLYLEAAGYITKKEYIK